MASSQTKPENQANTETWPRKLNKALIAIGVIAFGLIITDRLLEAFRADDPLEEAVAINRDDASVQPVVSISDSSEALQPDATTSEPASATQLDAVTENADSGTVAPSSEALVVESANVASDEFNESDALVELENLFGSRVVFVSASEPVYVVTEDERRFEVGSTVNDQTTLAGITAQQLILEKSGDLMIISLPDTTVQ